MTFNFDTSELSQAAARKITLHDNCIVLDLGAGSFPRDIEVRLPDDDGARQIAIWDGSLNLAINDEVLCNEYAGNPKWRVAGMGGADSGAGKQRVSEIWESDFGAVAMETDASGNVTINGTRTLTIPTDLIHAGDPDTLLSFTDDALEATIGNLSMLKLTETTQNLVEIGDTGGGGDVDVKFNNDQMFLQGSDGFLGFNTINPFQQIDAVADGFSSVFSLTAYKAASASIAGQLSFRAARGSLATPTALLSGDRMGSFVGIGHDGGGFDANFSVGIVYEADQNWTGAAQGTRINFQNTALDTTSRAVQMTLKSTGRLGILTANPAAQVHANQADATAAIPVLFLTQADVNQDMIQFSTTIGVGNAIEAVGGKTLTVTHFIKVTLPGALTRYFPVGTIA